MQLEALTRKALHLQLDDVMIMGHPKLKLRAQVDIISRLPGLKPYAIINPISYQNNFAQSGTDNFVLATG